MKKKVLFIIPSFRIGGTIVSLDSLLSIIDPSLLTIDVFSLDKEGEYISKLHNCRILPENIWLSSKIRHGSFFSKFTNTFLRVLKHFLLKMGCNPMSYYGRKAGERMGSIDYDAIVSYQEDLIGLVSYLPSRKTIGWIHSDYSRYKELINNIDETKYYSLVDRVVCVSEYARKRFEETLPAEAYKSCSIHNIINVREIQRKANDDSVLLDPAFDTSGFTIISAGRIDPVKQFEKIPFIAHSIRTLTSKPFKWYIIGGSRGFDWLEKIIIDNIVKNNVQDCVIRLSEKSNIYPYINKADIYVSTSSSESFPLVVEEAKALGIPPIINNFGSSSEVVCDGLDGYIVPLEKMGETIALFINEKQTDAPVRYYLSHHTYNNQEIIEKILSLFD